MASCQGCPASRRSPLVRQKWSALSEAENVYLTEPATYAEFAKLLARCYFVITDSGGIQGEAPSLGKPVLVARESTERTEGVEAGTLVMTGTDPDVVYERGTELIQNEAAYQQIRESKKPYGDGRASERIVMALANLVFGGEKPEPFGSGYSRRAVVEAAGFSVPYASDPRLDPELLPSALRGLRPHRDADEMWPDSSEIAESEPAT